MEYKVSKAIVNKSPPIEDLKELICQYNHDLRAKLDNCDRISSVVSLIFEEECSLTDIELLQMVVEEFQVTEAKMYIEQYETTLKEFSHSISIKLCSEEKFFAVENLRCGTATYVLNWRPEETKLQDILDLLSKIHVPGMPSQKIRYIEAHGSSVVITCSIHSSHFEDILKEFTADYDDVGIYPLIYSRHFTVFF